MTLWRFVRIPWNSSERQCSNFIRFARPSSSVYVSDIAHRRTSNSEMRRKWKMERIFTFVWFVAASSTNPTSLTFSLFLEQHGPYPFNTSKRKVAMRSFSTTRTAKLATGLKLETNWNWNLNQLQESLQSRSSPLCPTKVQTFLNNFKD